MTDEELKRENLYLKGRNAELQDSIVSLQAELTRVRSQLERFVGRSGSARSGGGN